MAKLFKLALESSDLEGAVASEPAQPALDESELEQNVEETTAQQAEIEQGEEEIDQALEEADGLVEQIEANDEKLENPDAVVTAADVEVSEEALKRACYSLGIPYQAKLSFAQESVANDIRANARKYLQTSNEELKDRLKRVVETIKKMVNAVVQKIQLFTKQIVLKFGNYYKRIDDELVTLKSESKKIGQLSSTDVLCRSLSGDPMAEVRYAGLNGKVYVAPLTNRKRNLAALNKFIEDLVISSQKIAKGDLVFDVAGAQEFNENLRTAEINIREFGYKIPNDNGEIKLFGITGNKGLTQYLKTIKLEKSDDDVLNFKGDTHLVESLLTYGGEVLKAIKEAKQEFDGIIKIQNYAKSKLSNFGVGSNEVEDKKQAKAHNAMLDVYKKATIDVAMFMIDEYIGAIKGYAKVLAVVSATLKKLPDGNGVAAK